MFEIRLFLYFHTLFQGFCHNEENIKLSAFKVWDCFINCFANHKGTKLCICKNAQLLFFTVITLKLLMALVLIDLVTQSN